MKNNQVLLYKQDTEELQALELKQASTLSQMYELIDCQTITIPSIKIGKNRYAVIADDEGLFNSPIYATIFNKGQPKLVGSFIITNYDDQGEQRGLTEKEVEEVKEHTRLLHYFHQELGRFIRAIEIY